MHISLSTLWSNRVFVSNIFIAQEIQLMSLILVICSLFNKIFNVVYFLHIPSSTLYHCFLNEQEHQCV